MIKYELKQKSDQITEGRSPRISDQTSGRTVGKKPNKNVNGKKSFCALLGVCILMGSTASCTFGAETEMATPQTAGEAYRVTVDYEEDDYFFDWKDGEYTSIDVGTGNKEITESGVYEITGTLQEGSLQVNVDKNADGGTVFLVLNGVKINSDKTAPINITEAKKVVLMLEEGASNEITQGKEITADESGNPSAAIFSKADLTIAGTGALNVTTAFNDGITSKDDLKITGGTINIKAENDGLTGKDLLAVETAVLEITAGKDGMRATNAEDVSKGNIVIEAGRFQITAGNDSVQAENVMQVEGGTLDISSGGGYAGVIAQAADNDFRGGGAMPPDMNQRPEMASGSAITSQGGMRSPMDRSTREEPTQSAVNGGTETTSSAVTTETESDSKKALKGGTAVLVMGGTYNISAYEDAVHSNCDVIIAEGTMNIETGDDAVHGDGSVTIENGKLTIKESYEGVEGANVTVNSGTIDLNSNDDGININSTAGALTLNGGKINIEAAGDGIDSNGNIEQNGGEIVINTESIGPGDSAVDYDGTFTANGGTLLDQSGQTITHSPGMQRGGGGRVPAEGQMPGQPPEEMNLDQTQSQ